MKCLFKSSVVLAILFAILCIPARLFGYDDVLVTNLTNAPDPNLAIAFNDFSNDPGVLTDRARWQFIGQTGGQQSFIQTFYSENSVMMDTLTYKLSDVGSPANVDNKEYKIEIYTFSSASDTNPDSLIASYDCIFPEGLKARTTSNQWLAFRLPAAINLSAGGYYGCWMTFDDNDPNTDEYVDFLGTDSGYGTYDDGIALVTNDTMVFAWGVNQDLAFGIYPPGTPLCALALEGDIDNNCQVDKSDMDILASEWLEDNNAQLPDPDPIKVVSAISEYPPTSGVVISNFQNETARAGCVWWSVEGEPSRERHYAQTFYVEENVNVASVCIRLGSLEPPTQACNDSEVSVNFFVFDNFGDPNSADQYQPTSTIASLVGNFPSDIDGTANAYDFLYFILPSEVALPGGKYCGFSWEWTTPDDAQERLMSVATSRAIDEGVAYSQGQMLRKSLDYYGDSNWYDFDRDLEFFLTSSDSSICTTSIISDITNDCRVTLLDFARLASDWLDCNMDPGTFCWQ